MTKRLLRFLVALLTHPLTILAGIFLGLIFGLFYKSMVPYVSPFGTIFCDLFGLCLLPIIFFSVVLGLTKLLRSPGMFKRLPIILGVYFVAMSLPVLMGLVAGIIGTPKHVISSDASISLGRIIKNTDYYSLKEKKWVSHDLSEVIETKNLVSYFVPKNVFADLAEGLSIKTILLALLFGVFLGLVKSEVTTELIKYFDLLHAVFRKLLNWILCFLPLGLVGLFAQALSEMNLLLVKSLAILVLVLYVSGLVLLIFYHAILSYSFKESFGKVISKFRYVLMLGFLLESAIIPLPTAASVIKNKFPKSQLSEMLLSVGLVINQHGKILLFILMTLFMVNFYQISLPWADFIFVIFLCMITGVVANGKLTFLAPVYMVICTLVGLPAEMGVLILMTLDPFITRWCAVITLHANCALVAFIERKGCENFE